MARLWRAIQGGFASVALGANSVTICLCRLPVALLKPTPPSGAVRRGTDRVLYALAEGWIATHGGWMALVRRTRWDVQGHDGLRRQGWYLVSSHHQSWVDSFIVQRVVLGRVPFLKVFLKRQLLVALVGLAWWALGFPFMKRRTGSRSQDLATARRACEKFRQIPTSVMNLLEGTRFSQEKHDRQGSSYRHLLKPRVGGLATALSAMGERFDARLEVTIVYPGGVPSFRDLLSGRVPQVVVRMCERPIPPSAPACRPSCA